MQLVELRRYHELAVGLVRIIGVIFLVVLFRLVELGQRLQRSHDRFAEGLGSIELFNKTFRLPLLFVVGIENSGAILRADVIALAIERRRIMGREENGEQVLEGDLARIEFDLDDFRMSGEAAADLLVGGFFTFPPAYPETTDRTPRSS